MLLLPLDEGWRLGVEENTVFFYLPTAASFTTALDHY